MPSPQFLAQVKKLRAEELRYSTEAYVLVADAVSYTVSRLKVHRHVSALELLDGFRDFAAKQYGAVYPLVLRKWGIRTASDVGEIVYLLISVKLLSASADDRREEFDVDYPLEQPPPAVRRRPRLPYLC